MSPIKELIFQLGTNNWQRQKKDGSGIEFAPGSGVLHEGHHNSFNNDVDGVKCYSIYPSEKQGQPTDKDATYQVFELEHPIPICESAAPESTKRWHSMSDEEFNAYADRLELQVYEYMKDCEAREGSNFTMCIAHHSFLNPLILKRVIQRRTTDGLPKIPLYCFVHGTGLKMYRWELGPKETDEQKLFPMRFHKMLVDEKIFNDVYNGVTACFVISQEQKKGVAEIFPSFPQDRVIVSPNGINVKLFSAREKSLVQVLFEQTRTVVWPTKFSPPGAQPSETDLAKYKRLVVFVGKAAEWKRQAALLYAMAEIQKVDSFADVALLCFGKGPDHEMKKLTDLCEELGLENTFILGGRGHDDLAEVYTVAHIGCFPSFHEPFGLVFVECMACGTPVIGANSGGPKDFVSASVGELVQEPPETKDLSTVTLAFQTLGATLAETIGRALTEDWKTTKGKDCVKLALDRFTVKSQVVNMLAAKDALPKL